MTEKTEDLIAEARAERDAALAVVERVRAAVVKGSLMDPTPTRMEPDTAHESELWWQSYHLRANEAWRDNILAALDGAPEPEGRWEYRGRLQSCGYVAEGYISAEYAMNGLRVELEDHPYLAMDDTAIVERARVREWLPVEGEKRES